MMIDPGATHNFISTSTIARLEIPITGNREFGVSLGNGTVGKGTGECVGVELDLRGCW